MRFLFIYLFCLGFSNPVFAQKNREMECVGIMAGECITLKEFEEAMAKLGANIPTSQVREIVWNTFLYERIFAPEAKKLGIKLTEAEALKLLLGDSSEVHPNVLAQFVNPVTRRFDHKSAREVYAKMQKNETNKSRIDTYIDGLSKDKIRTTYEDLLRSSTYVTQAEAEREHEAQNQKAEVKFLYIPFTSIVDSTIVKEAEMQDFLNKNPQKFKGRESRSLEYIAIDVKPSKEDSIKFTDELRELGKEFVKTQDDYNFAKINSELPNFDDNRFITPDNLPLELFRKHLYLGKGGVYPILDGKTYKIIKIIDIKKDTTSIMVRASHILFKADKTASEEIKTKARKDAEEVLKKIKDGGNFEEMAKKYGSDGTAPNGGDLGWFGKGRMVMSFEDAVFNAPEGLVQNLVITDFGYHILQVTQAKTFIQYKVATISRTLQPSDKSSERALAEARTLSEKCKTLEEFRAFAKKNPKYIIEKAEKVNPTSNSLNAIQNAREPIRWAFTEATVGAVSQPMELKDQNIYIVVALTAKVEKDEVSINAFREELKTEVLKQIKTKTIIAKLDTKGKTLDEIAKKYGKDALTGEANDLSMSKDDLQSYGFNPISVGKAMGLKAGKRSEVIIDNTGIFIIEMVKITPAPVVTDYTQYKNTLEQDKAGMASYYVQEALKEYKKLKDYRYKFW